MLGHAIHQREATREQSSIRCQRLNSTSPTRHYASKEDGVRRASPTATRQGWLIAGLQFCIRTPAVHSCTTCQKNTMCYTGAKKDEPREAGSAGQAICRKDGLVARLSTRTARGVRRSTAQECLHTQPQPPVIINPPIQGACLPRLARQQESDHREKQSSKSSLKGGTAGPTHYYLGPIQALRGKIAAWPTQAATPERDSRVDPTR